MKFTMTSKENNKTYSITEITDSKKYFPRVPKKVKDADEEKENPFEKFKKESAEKIEKVDKPEKEEKEEKVEKFKKIEKPEKTDKPEKEEKADKPEDKKLELTKDDIKVLKDLVAAIPQLLEAINGPSGKKEDKPEKDKVGDEIIMETPDEDAEFEEEAEIEPDGEIDATEFNFDEDFGADDEEESVSYESRDSKPKSAVSVETKKVSDSCVDHEEEVSNFFDNYYSKQLHK